MFRIIQTKKHYLTRLPLGFLGITLFAFSPFLIGVMGAWATEKFSGQPCHEGNCGWMVLPWLTVFTLPIGAFLLLVFLLMVVRDSLDLYNTTLIP